MTDAPESLDAARSRAADLVREAADGPTAIRIYEEAYFPTAIAWMKTRAEPCDTLVVTVGHQHWSVALSMVRHPATEVVAVCSSSTEAVAIRAGELAGRPAHSIQRRTVHPHRSIEVYREIRAVAERSKGRKVVVDISSGTKPMTAGASTAAGFFRMPQAYISAQSLRPDTELRGLEDVHTLDHPLAVFGDDVRREAEQAHDQGLYEVAARSFDDLDKVRAPDFHDGARAHLSRACGHWRGLRFVAAAEEFDAARSALEAARPHLRREPLVGVSGRLGEQSNAALMLARATARDSRTPHHPELAATMMRYLLQLPAWGHGDTGLTALLAYRALEAALQRRLAIHGLDADAPDYTSLPGDLLDRFNAVAGSRYAVQELPSKIACAQAYSLLATLGDAVVEGGIPAKQFADRTQIRNQSVFTHGYRVIEERDLSGLRDIAGQIVDKTLRADGFERPASDAVFTPIRYSDLEG